MCFSDSQNATGLSQAREHRPPDGRSLGLVSGKKLLKVPLDGQATDAKSAAPSWSADGRTIYYSSIETSGNKTAAATRNRIGEKHSAGKFPR